MVREPQAHLVARVASGLMSASHYRTMQDTGSIYVYDPATGVYKNGIEWQIKAAIQRDMGVEAGIHNAQEVVECIRRSTVTDRSLFGRDPELLCVGNGILNVRTLTLSPHSPDKLFVRRVSANYDPDADCPVTKRFLSQIVDSNNVHRLKQFIGYTLMPGYRYHKAFILVGTGDNGKDTFCHLLITFLGKDNCSNLTLQQMCNDKFQRPQLFGKVANIAPEMGSLAIRDTESLKSLSGESAISVENKNEKPFNFTNDAKLIFACNEIPAAEGADRAYYGRWIIIPFPNEFKGRKRNPNLREELTTPQELSGLLNFALEGVRSLKDNHGFDYPDDYEGTRIIYQAWSGSTVDRFFATQLVLDPTSSVTKQEIMTEYRAYCLRLGKPSDTDAAFFTKFSKLVGYDVVESYATVKGERVWVVKGIRFKRSTEDAQDTIPYTISIKPREFSDDGEEAFAEVPT